MKNCLHCGKEIIITEKRHNDKKFCNRSCSAKYGNENREITDRSRENISKGLKLYFQNNPDKRPTSENCIKNASEFTKGRFKGNLVESILLLSKRTVSKIFKRLGVGCSRCGWNEATCDIHHIYGRKIENANSHDNLTYLCPNCHRMFHCKKIGVKDVITLKEYIGDKWRDYYYG